MVHAKVPVHSCIFLRRKSVRFSFPETYPKETTENPGGNDIHSYQVINYLQQSGGGEGKFNLGDGEMVKTAIP